MLLKGLIEVRDATRPIAALEMALIRVCYAADLPPTEKLVRDLLDARGPEANAPQGVSPPSASTLGRPQGSGASGSAMRAPQPHNVPTPSSQNETAPALRGLEDIVALAAANHAPILRVHIENDVHLIRLESGLLEFRPGPRAPRKLAGDLQQKLNSWTGMRWSVSVAREGGAPTLAEQKKAAKAARMESVAQDPMVRAVLDRFPGAEIVAVREAIIPDVAMPDADDL
jgi:DNA polymerase-3 subunit gamma/tau